MTIPALAQGVLATITATVNQEAANDGYLQGWIDWNGDGDFADSGEQIATNLQLASGISGTISVPVTPPFDAITNQTFARFRWSTTQNLDSTSAASDGEVEDYAITIQIGLDFGDAPSDLSAIDADMTTAYPTLIANNGASHQLDGTTFLGAAVDAEANGQPTTAANGDTDDGVSFPTLGSTDVLLVGRANSVSVTASVAGFLNVWMDHNQDGDWDDAGERVFTNQAVSAGSNTLSITPNTLQPTRDTYLRFRFTSASVASPVPTGALANGEVEDYRVAVVLPAPRACASGLINGGFEGPTTSSYTIIPENTVGGWSTLANDPNATHSSQSNGFIGRNSIELWHSGFNSVPAYEGNQFAELNAYVAGSLYQDLETTPGSVVTYQFAHRGRGGNDTVDVMMGPPGATTSQTGGTGYTTGNTAWAVYTGNYTVPAGQHITRFSFQAVSAASGDNSVGNFIDTVEFGFLCNDDYGDAPASYGDATHQVPNSPTVFIGATAPDIDTVTQNAANGGADGLGDDNNGSDDEDAYDTLPPLWTTASQYRLVVACNAQGSKVSGWIDFNQNGQFDAGERSDGGARNCPSSNRVVLNWTGLSGVVSGSSYARIRVASAANDIALPTGSAADGEVEDYPITFQAPSAGPAVCVGKASWLNLAGQRAEPVTPWTVNWAERNINAAISFSTTMPGTNAHWTAAARTATDADFISRFGDNGSVVNLNYPNDLSGNGSTIADFVFDQPLPANTYMVVRDVDAKNETVTFSNYNLGALPVPSLWESNDPLSGNTPSIFAGWDGVNQRLMTIANGPNNDQEAYVWDAAGMTSIRATYTTYAGSANISFVSCIPQDFGDAPDTYGTTKAANGAQHGVISDVYLGAARPDTEADGLFGAAANGDDTDATDDEDGISNLPSLTDQQTRYQITVNATNAAGNSAQLIAWIDFDGNGSFDADEAAMRTIPAGATANNYTLTWSSIPVDRVAGDTYLRVRLTTDTLTNQDPTGSKLDGEVEDYAMSIITAGVTVSGRVYRDVNVNGISDAGEVGVTNLPVVLYNTATQTCVSARTDGNGRYQFKKVAPGNYRTYEASRERVPVPANCNPALAKDPSGYRSTTANARAAFDVVGSDISGEDFGDVKPPAFAANQRGQVLAGNVVFYPHKLTTPTTGTVSFNSVSSGNVSTGWSSIIYQDVNCNGVLDATEASSPLSGSVAVDASTPACLINKVYAPSNVAANDTYQQVITATFDYNNSLAGTHTLKVTDVTTAQQVQAPTVQATPPVVAAPATPAQPAVPATPETPYTPPVDEVPAQQPVPATPVVPEVGPSRLELRKTVRNVDKGSAETATVNVADPGDTLEYKIYYRNSGTGPLTDLVINDNLPEYTEIVGTSTSLSNCGTVPTGMGCSRSSVGLDGDLRWTFTGPLIGGAGSFVSYRVKIDN